MKRKLTGLAREYRAALGKHLKQGPRVSLQRAQSLGRQATALGLETLDLARIHEQALIKLVLPSYSPGTRDAMVRRAGIFFAKAITPIEKTHRAALKASVPWVIACGPTASPATRLRLPLNASPKTSAPLVSW